MLLRNLEHFRVSGSSSEVLKLAYIRIVDGVFLDIAGNVGQGAAC
jgi:hypothetical protein